MQTINTHPKNNSEQDLEWRSSDGGNALQHHLKKKNDKEIDKWINAIKKNPCKYKAFINHQDDKGNTPLMYAIEHYPKYIDKILELVPDLSAVNHNQHNCLFLAFAKKGLPDQTCKQLLDRCQKSCKEAINNKDNRERNLLMYTVLKADNTSRIQILLGINIFNSKLPCRDGYNLLHYAACNGDLSILQLLTSYYKEKFSDEGYKDLAHGRSRNGSTILHVSARNGITQNCAMVKSLVNNKENTTSMKVSILHPSVRNNTGETPLHCVCRLKGQRFIDNIDDRIQTINFLLSYINVNDLAIGISNVENRHNQINERKAALIHTTQTSKTTEQYNKILEKVKKHDDYPHSDEMIAIYSAENLTTKSENLLSSLKKIVEESIDSHNTEQQRQAIYSWSELALKNMLQLTEEHDKPKIKNEQSETHDLSALETQLMKEDNQRKKAETKPKNIQQCGYSAKTVLAEAIKWGNLKVIKLLMEEKGALFGIFSVHALDTLKKSENLQDRYEQVTSYLIEKGILTESGEIQEDQIPTILQNTKTILDALDLKNYKYAQYMTKKEQPEIESKTIEQAVTETGAPHTNSTQDSDSTPSTWNPEVHQGNNRVIPLQCRKIALSAIAGIVLSLIVIPTTISTTDIAKNNRDVYIFSFCIFGLTCLASYIIVQLFVPDSYLICDTEKVYKNVQKLIEQQGKVTEVISDF